MKNKHYFRNNIRFVVSEVISTNAWLANTHPNHFSGYFSKSKRCMEMIHAPFLDPNFDQQMLSIPMISY